MNSHPDMANLSTGEKAGVVRTERTINLALQGGGAHGAFTWGVLDRLLDEPNLSFEGIVATSAGAMNAAVLAYGLAEGGRRGAQKALANFWRRVSHAAAFSPLQPSPFDRMTGSRSLEHSPAFMVFDMVTRTSSIRSMLIRCGPYSSSRSTSPPFACRAVPSRSASAPPTFARARSRSSRMTNCPSTR